jgi:hypothetical protein
LEDDIEGRMLEFGVSVYFRSGCTGLPSSSLSSISSKASLVAVARFFLLLVPEAEESGGSGGVLFLLLLLLLINASCGLTGYFLIIAGGFEFSSLSS